MEEYHLQSIKTVLIANRGEIACRCIRACKKLGATSVSIYTESDAGSLHVSEADEAVLLAGAGSAGYLDMCVISNTVKIPFVLTCKAVMTYFGYAGRRPQMPFFQDMASSARTSSLHKE